MNIETKKFDFIKAEAKKLYDSQRENYNPFFKSNITFSSDGFHHLQFSARRERNKSEQILKFRLLPLAIGIIRNSGTLQEYRKNLLGIGKKGKDGLRKTKEVEYFGFIAIVGKEKIKIRVVLRRVGDGNITFWSVMPYSKLKKGQKKYTDGIDDE